MTSYARRVRFKPYITGPTFTLTIWDDLSQDHPSGKLRLRYRLSRNGRTIFQGSDFATPHASDSDDVVRDIMSFLTLRPGDIEIDYFKDYTAEQWSFVRNDAETLSIAVLDMFGE